jgi:hypothetical protein
MGARIKMPSETSAYTTRGEAYQRLSDVRKYAAARWTIASPGLDDLVRTSRPFH